MAWRNVRPGRASIATNAEHERDDSERIYGASCCTCQLLDYLTRSLSYLAPDTQNVFLSYVDSSPRVLLVQGSPVSNL